MHLATRCRQHQLAIQARTRCSALQLHTAPQAGLASIRREALTVQHKTEKTMQLVLKAAESPCDSSRMAGTAGLWKDILSDTFDNLSRGAERPARVVVLGMDEWAGIEDLTSALLEDPLSSDQHQTVLRERRKSVGASSCLTISTQPNEPVPSHVQISSSYLSQFSVPVEITELRAPSPLSTSRAVLPTTLFKADVPIVVFNPLTTPLSTLEHLSFPSHTIFVATQNPHLNHSSLQQTLNDKIPTSLHTPEGQRRLLFIDPVRALQGVQSFRANPTSPIGIQQYQDNFTGSSISYVTEAIRDIVDAGISTPSPSAFLQNRTAIVQLENVLKAFYMMMQNVQRRLDDIHGGVSWLTGRIEEEKAKVQGDILGHTHDGDREQEAKRGGRLEVDDSLRLAGKEMKDVLGKLSWWRAMWRADEISWTVGNAVDRVWCRDLEKKLILQTGRLLSLQKELTKSANSLVNLQSSTPPLPSNPKATSLRPLFSAHVLKNRVSQLTASPSYTLTSSTLTHPIVKRKDQLLAYPTTRLHLTAQRAVIGMSAGVAGGTGFTWAGWMGYLMQSAGEGSMGVWNVVGMGMDPATGMGIGLLSIVASVRWAVGKWEREKKRWWGDWERIGQGLDRDLKSTVDEVMRDRVIAVAETACNGLKELCQKRQEEVDLAKDDIQRLQDELKDIASRMHA